MNLLDAAAVAARWHLSRYTQARQAEQPGLFWLLLQSAFPPVAQAAERTTVRRLRRAAP